METMIQGFLDSLSADGKSKCTISAYKCDLEAFSAVMQENKKQISQIKYQDLREWANRLKSDGLSASTRARKISAVKSFFKYLYKMDVVGSNPAELLESPKIEKKQPKVISIEDAKKALQNAAGGPIKGFAWFRDYTILATFLFTGIRREELTNIKMEDVDLEQRTILIHGKGAKQRIVYINDSLLAVLSEYIHSYRKIFSRANESQFLFLSTKSCSISVNTVNAIVNKAFENAGIKEVGISSHILRKRFATSIFQDTSDIATTSEMLGHSSPTVTMRYVVIDEDRKRTAANSVSF